VSILVRGSNRSPLTVRATHGRGIGSPRNDSDPDFEFFDEFDEELDEWTASDVTYSSGLVHPNSPSNQGLLLLDNFAYGDAGSISGSNDNWSMYADIINGGSGPVYTQYAAIGLKKTYPSTSIIELIVAVYGTPGNYYWAQELKYWSSYITVTDNNTLLYNTSPGTGHWPSGRLTMSRSGNRITASFDGGTSMWVDISAISSGYAYARVYDFTYYDDALDAFYLVSPVPTP